MFSWYWFFLGFLILLNSVAENLGRLKKLEYLNVALNNIERIENLEGCILLYDSNYHVILCQTW